MAAPIDIATEQYERWKLEHRMIEDLLAHCEKAERKILTDLGCPTNPAAVYDIIAGHRPAPWPKRNAARNKLRANHAMFALTFIRDVRHFTSIGTENACQAAYAALMVGMLANDAAINAALGYTVLGTLREISHRKRERQKGAPSDTAIRREADAIRRKHKHGRDYSTRKLALVIAAKQGRKTNTVRAALKRLQII